MDCSKVDTLEKNRTGFGCKSKWWIQRSHPVGGKVNVSRCHCGWNGQAGCVSCTGLHWGSYAGPKSPKSRKKNEKREKEKKRKKNIIVYRLPEPTAANSDDRRKEDLNHTEELLHNKVMMCLLSTLLVHKTGWQTKTCEVRPPDNRIT